MSELINALVLVMLGAFMGPYLSHFLSGKKTKQEKRLQYLEEAYTLASLIKAYALQELHRSMHIVACLTNKGDINSFPKSVESPFNRLATLLDYNLSAPAALIDKAESLKIEIQSSVRPIAEAINNPNEKNSFFKNAINVAIDASEKSPNVSNEIIQWIKDERLNIESELTPFQILYWQNIWSKCLKHSQDILCKREGK